MAKVLRNPKPEGVEVLLGSGGDDEVVPELTQEEQQVGGGADGGEAPFQLSEDAVSFDEILVDGGDATEEQKLEDSELITQVRQDLGELFGSPLAQIIEDVRPATERARWEASSTVTKSEAVVEPSRPWITLSPEEEERLGGDPKYLERLYQLDQNYITPQLDREHEILIRGAAVLTVDVKGFSTFAYRLHEVMDKPSYAARFIGLRMDDIRQQMTGIVQLYGGQTDNFLGDGMNVLFAGEQAIQRAASAARDIRDAISKLEAITVESLSTDIRVRIGIGYGDVWLASYGNTREKRADLTGPAVLEAEQVQSIGKRHPDERGAEITISEVVAERLSGGYSFLEGEEGVCSLDRLHGSDAVLPGIYSYQPEVLDNPEAIKQAIDSRERFLSRTRRGELHRQFLRDREPRQDRTAISTVFVRIPELVNRAISYERRNALMEKIFEIADVTRGKIDKIHHDTVMINFLAGTNDENSLEVSLRIRDYLLEAQATGFALACSRGESFDLAMGSAHTVYGRSVNAARRMLDYKNPGGGMRADGKKGGVVVDEDTDRHLRRMRLTEEELPAMRLKGFEDRGPIKRYLITDMESAHLRLEEGRKLIARENELAQLHQWYQGCMDDGGKLVLVRGEQGIGKTVLISEFMRQLHEQGVYVIAGRAEPYTQKEPFAVLRDMFDQMFKLHRSDSLPDRRKIVEEFFTTNQLKTELDRLALMNEFFGTDFKESTKITDMDPEDRNTEQVRLVLEIFNGLRHIERPAAIALENTQYWDEQTIEFMRRLLPRMNESQVMMIATGWDLDKEQRDLSVAGLQLESANTHELQLGGLTVCDYDYDQIKEALELAKNTGDVTEYRFRRGQLEEMDKWWDSHRFLWYEAINSVIPIDKQDFEQNEAGWRRIIFRMAHKTRGNFRYVEQVLYDLVIYKGKDRYFEEREVIGEDGHSKSTVYVLGARRIQDEFFSEIKEMEKLEEEIINSLGDEVASLIRDASVIGTDFDVKTLALLSKVLPEKIHEAMKIAQRYGLVISRGEGFYEFWRGQNAAYNSIGDVRERQLKHRRLAYHFEESEPNNLPRLVRHFSHSDDYLKALHYLEKYITQLRQHDLSKAALNHIYDDDFGYADIFNKIRQRSWNVLDTSMDEPINREMTPEEIDTVVDNHVALMMDIAARAHRDAGDRPRATKAVQYARSVFADAHPQFDDMDVHDQITWANFYRELAVDDAYLEPFETGQIHLYWAEKLLDEVNIQLEQGQINGEVMANYRKAKAFLCNTFGWAYKMNRDYEEALPYFVEGARFADTYDEQKRLLQGQALTYKDLGRREEAERMYQDLVDLVSQHGQKRDIVAVLNNFATHKARGGDDRSAAELYHQALALGREIPMTSGIYNATYGLAFLERSAGNNEIAFSMFRDVQHHQESRGMLNSAVAPLAEAVVCLISLGRLDEARALIANLRQRPSIKGVAEARSYTLEAFVVARENGDTVDDVSKSLFDTGVEMLRRSGSLGDLAYDLLYFGEMEILSGQIKSGRSKVLEAKSIYQQTGELSEMAHLEDILAHAGHTSSVS